MSSYAGAIFILCLLTTSGAKAEGIPRAEIAKRCAAARTNTVQRLHETQTLTMTLSNEGKPCVIAEYWFQDGSGSFGNRSAFENFTVNTPPTHGTLSYRSDSASYVLYQPAVGYVGTDNFEYRLYPGNGLRTVTVTVGP